MLAVFETTFILILFFQKLHELCLTGRSCRARVGQAKQARQVKSQCFSDVVIVHRAAVNKKLGEQSETSKQGS